MMSGRPMSLALHGVRRPPMPVARLFVPNGEEHIRLLDGLQRRFLSSVAVAVRFIFGKSFGPMLTIQAGNRSPE